MRDVTMVARVLRSTATAFLVTALAVIFAGPALALDVTRPASVAHLLVDPVGGDVRLAWDPVTLDAAGQPETVDHYNVYRGIAPSFVPDKIGGTNRIGSPTTLTFDDLGALSGVDDYYYLITAVDTAGNESDSKAALVTTPPVLNGYWTDDTIEVDWSGAAPTSEIMSYRVYYGRKSGVYEAVDDVGLATSHSLPLFQLSEYENWYVAVTAVDGYGNESDFSNEHVDAVGGVVRLRVQDGDELCWDASTCIPADPSKIQRNNGWQLLVPAQFPEGDWVSVTVTYTIESRLCVPPRQGTITKCGSGNPCVSPPCNGGYNPCGDPWDRTAHLFLVLDDCVSGTGSCITNDNLELIRAVTPFGTDGYPPQGTAVVPPRQYTMDITPFAPLLTGTKYVGTEIVHFVQKGWWVTVDFTFSKRPEQASPTPPADGIQVVGFGGAPLPTRQVAVPMGATQVDARIFTTGHGGATYCDGGSNNGQPCTGQSQCPGGVCNPCDEFCHRENRLLLNGDPIWQVTPWRTDCDAAPGCSTWNACGYPSCTFPRAGWCPGYIACPSNAPCSNDVDLTSQIPPGGTYDFDYDVLVQNGSWSISVVLYWYY